ADVPSGRGAGLPDDALRQHPAGDVLPPAVQDAAAGLGTVVARARRLAAVRSAPGSVRRAGGGVYAGGAGAAVVAEAAVAAPGGGRLPGVGPGPGAALRRRPAGGRMIHLDVAGPGRARLPPSPCPRLGGSLALPRNDWGRTTSQQR